MSERDPDKLADELEQGADQMQDRSQELEGDIEGVRQDWERKRADESIPGAQPLSSEEEEARSGDGRAEEETGDVSPGAEAPPENESPGAAETASEGAVGPPKDQVEDP
jgi:TolA-binding protein